MKSCLSVVWAHGHDPAAATRLIQAEVAALARVPPGEVRLRQVCPRCGSDRHGPLQVRPWPDATPPYVSLSRSRGVVMVGVCTTHPVGVDVEVAARFEDPAVDDVLLHDAEQVSDAHGRARTWVRKESLLKAAGRGLAVDLRHVRLSAPDDHPRLLHWYADEPRPDPVWMCDIDLGTGLAAAATVIGPGPGHVIVRQADPATPGC